MGKFTKYINTTSNERIEVDFNVLSEKQMDNVDLLIDLMSMSN